MTRVERNCFALSFSYQQAPLTMTDSSAKQDRHMANWHRAVWTLGYVDKMVNNTPRQPEETQPLDFLGGTQNATVFCSRSHCRWEKWGLAEDENSLLRVVPSLWRSLRGPWLYQDAALKGKASVRSEAWDGALFSTDSSHGLPKTFSDLNSTPSGAGHFQLSLRKQPLWPNCLLEDVHSHFYKAIIKRFNFSILHWRDSFTGYTYLLFIRRPRTGNPAFQQLSLRHSESFPGRCDLV